MTLKRSPAKAEPASAETRQALLDAAAEVFARRGFSSATVREICDRAGANIAAVNYHFRDKESLYAAVLKHSLHAAIEKYPPHSGLAANAPAADRLHAFIHSFLMRLFDDSRHAWHGKLISREMVEPTAALDEIVHGEIRPMAEMLQGIVRELLGRGANDEAVRLCALSVVSQCVFYHHARAVVSRLFPQIKLGAPIIPTLAEHITAFSLAGIKAQSASPRRKRQG